MEGSRFPGVEAPERRKVVEDLAAGKRREELEANVYLKPRWYIDAGVLQILSGPAAKVHELLCMHRNNATDECWPKQTTLAENLNVDVGHVRRAMRELRRWRLIHKKRHAYGQRHAIYIVVMTRTEADKFGFEPPLDYEKVGGRNAPAKRKARARIALAKRKARARNAPAKPVCTAITELDLVEEEERDPAAAAALRQIKELSADQITKALKLPTTTALHILAARLECRYGSDKPKPIGLLYSLILKPSNIGEKYLDQAKARFKKVAAAVDAAAGDARSTINAPVTDTAPADTAARIVPTVPAEIHRAGAEMLRNAARKAVMS